MTETNATPAPLPEPHEDTIIVDRDGEVWLRRGVIFKDHPWRTAGGHHVGWEWLARRRAPFRIAVPLTDEERTELAALVRRYSESRYDPAEMLALADRIEGTQP